GAAIRLHVARGEVLDREALTVDRVEDSVTRQERDIALGAGSGRDGLRRSIAGAVGVVRVAGVGRCAEHGRCRRARSEHDRLWHDPAEIDGRLPTAREIATDESGTRRLELRHARARAKHLLAIAGLRRRVDRSAGSSQLTGLRYIDVVDAAVAIERGAVTAQRRPRPHISARHPGDVDTPARTRAALPRDILAVGRPCGRQPVRRQLPGDVQLPGQHGGRLEPAVRVRTAQQPVQARERIDEVAALPREIAGVERRIADRLARLGVQLERNDEQAGGNAGRGTRSHVTRTRHDFLPDGWTATGWAHLRPRATAATTRGAAVIRTTAPTTRATAARAGMMGETSPCTE